MRDTFMPYMLVVLPHPSTPLPPPPPPKSNNMAMLYYGLVVVGTAAAILAIYNILLMRWCAHNSTTQRTNQPSRIPVRSSSLSSTSSNINLISSKFKYTKGGGGGGDECGSSDQKDQGASEYECVVCLSVFEEGEELRQLPICKHSFHASCIDMWLYSHLDCPLCRSPVEPPILCCSPLPVVVVPQPVVERNSTREVFHNFSILL